MKKDKPKAAFSSDDPQAKMVGFTAVIAVTGVIGAVIFWFQLAAMQKQATLMQGQLDAMRAANESDRPWIGYRDQLLPQPQTKQSLAEITVVNAGKTPAQIEKFEFGMRLAATLADDASVPMKNSIEGNEIVVPGQNIHDNLNVPAIPREHLDDVLSGRVNAYAYGRIIYQDVVTKKDHETRLCWVYNRLKKDWFFCSNYNSAD